VIGETWANTMPYRIATTLNDRALLNWSYSRFFIIATHNYIEN